jgi:hypothetical protein
MKADLRKSDTLEVWGPIFGGPVLSLLVFVAAWWINPLGLSDLKEIPAFFLSVISLTISQWLVTVQEIRKTTDVSHMINNAIKSHLHVTVIGSPEDALKYIASQLPSVRFVFNTSFTLDSEKDESASRVYKTEAYAEFSAALLDGRIDQLSWKDVGDQSALKRMRASFLKCRAYLGDDKGPERYNYKTIQHLEPQMNFIILEYAGAGKREVLFNWDFRSNGDRPRVLISQDEDIVRMFAAHFSLLWEKASKDNDMP